MNMNRRNFLYQTFLAGSTALMLGGFRQRALAYETASNSRELKAFGYGNLAPKAAANTGEKVLALPDGFEYNIIGKVGASLGDGQKTPRAHDGMATFNTKGELRIIRNHEINDRRPKPGVAIGQGNHYDEAAGGGTTTLIIDPRTREITHSFISLSGTLNNCAGGATPWGSWISCEETTFGQTRYKTKEGAEVGGFAKPHGYCFEVPASANNNPSPVPLKAMGRFVHEAIAIDRKSGIVYLTEDNNPAGFYRFIPNKQKKLAEGGTLQILKVKGQPQYDTRKAQKNGTTLPVEWITIEKPDPMEADVDSSAVYKEGHGKGAALFARLEGCFAGDRDGAYFASTNGGDLEGGQIWSYTPSNRDEGTLTLLYESTDRQILDMPDNIALYPNSKLLFMCEDSDYGISGATPENLIRILTPDGKIADFAKNITPGAERSEFAGATFTRDGKTLFANVQAAGLTVAIWGDWKQFKG